MRSHQIPLIKHSLNESNNWALIILKQAISLWSPSYHPYTIKIYIHYWLSSRLERLRIGSLEVPTQQQHECNNHPKEIQKHHQPFTPTPSPNSLSHSQFNSILFGEIANMTWKYLIKGFFSTLCPNNAATSPKHHLRPTHLPPLFFTPLPRHSTPQTSQICSIPHPSKSLEITTHA